VEDVVKLGDKVTVKLFEIDDQGRLNLSIKQADPNYKPDENAKEDRPARPPRGDRGHRR